MGTYCYSLAVNESLNQSGMKRKESIARSFEMQQFGNISCGIPQSTYLDGCFNFSLCPRIFGTD